MPTSHFTAKPNTTIAYTDGACKGNPGQGGWGACLVFADGQIQELFGGELDTTNNRMELMGAIQALQHSPTEQTLEVWTDSTYVMRGITEWIEGWKKKQWKKVKNPDLWQQLDALCQNRSVEWHWVKGHAGHFGNEKADELANKGVASLSQCTQGFVHQGSISGNDDGLKKNSAKMCELREQATMINQIDNTNDSSYKNISIQNNINEPTDWLNDDPLGFAEIDDEDFWVEDSNKKENNIHKSMQTDGNHANFDNNNLQTDIDKMAKIDDDWVEFDGDTSRANPNFRPLLPDPIYKHSTNRQLILDTETTGLDPSQGHRIIEVGIVELVGRKFTGEKLHVYINPERDMEEDAVKVHGITTEFLADKPNFAQVAKRIYDFIDGAEVIAHNASFDMNFLIAEFDKVGLTDFAQRVTVTDTLAIAKQQYAGQKNSLDALVKRLNVGKQDRTFHGALLDAEILAEVYLAMTGGQVSLAIDDEMATTDGSSSHTNFSKLASLLVTSPKGDDEHEVWFGKMVEKYPNLQTIWKGDFT